MNAPCGPISSDVRMTPASCDGAAPATAISVQSEDSNTEIYTHPPTPTSIYNGDFPLLLDADTIVPAAQIVKTAWEHPWGMTHQPPPPPPRILSPKTSLNVVSGPFGPQNSTARAGALGGPPSWEPT